MQVNLIFHFAAFEQIRLKMRFYQLVICMFVGIIPFMTIHEPWIATCLIFLGGPPYGRLMDAEFSYFRIGRQYPIRIISLVLYPDISDILSVI